MTTHDADARALVALYAERVALTKAMAESAQPTGVMADAVLAKGAELDAACERFRRRYYPHRHRVAVGLYAVFSVSRTGQARQILDLSDEYREAVR